MGPIAEQIARLTAWEHRESGFQGILPFLPLGAASLLAVLVEVPGTPPVGGTLAVAAGAAAWIAWFLVVKRWTARPRLMVLYYLGLLTFAAVLVLRNPWYGYFAWVGFVHAFIALPGGWRFLGAAASAVLVATAQSGGPPHSPGHWLLWTLVVVVNLTVAGALSWFSFVSQRQHANRRQLISDLGEANRRLADTMRENEGLHAQLLHQAREAGVLDERQRMAREIHDTLAQGLVGIITQLEAAEQARDRQGDWQRHVSDAAALARESLTEARRSVRAVRPEALETARLPEALGELTRRWSTI
ncbi:MAG TPA: histidine kinase, partial [Micromonospora sp.]